MSGEWKCRECKNGVAQAAHLRLPSRGGLCLSCADKMMAKYKAQTLHELVPRYVRDHQSARSTVASLQERVRQLEALISAMGQIPK